MAVSSFQRLLLLLWKDHWWDGGEEMVLRFALHRPRSCCRDYGCDWGGRDKP